MNPETRGKPYSIGLTLEVFDRDGTPVDSAMLRHTSAVLKRWRPEEGDLDVCLQQARIAIEDEIRDQRQDAEKNVSQLLMERMGNPRGGKGVGDPPPAVLEPSKINHASFFQEEVDDAILGFTQRLLARLDAAPPPDCSTSFLVGWSCAHKNTVKPEDPQPEPTSIRYEMYRGLRGTWEALEACTASILYGTKPPEIATPESQIKDSFDRGYANAIASWYAAGGRWGVLQVWANNNIGIFRKGLDKVPLVQRMKVFGIDPLNPLKPLASKNQPPRASYETHVDDPT